MSGLGFHDFVVSVTFRGERLDKVLGSREGCSRTLARKLIDAGAVFVNGRRTRRASLPVREGDRIRAPEQLPPLPEASLGEPLHRERDVLVVNKPVGVPSAPTPLGIRGTLPELARQRYGLGRAPIVVHRLDTDVSGVLALALSKAGARRITRWFTEGLAEKWYRARVLGCPEAPEGRIEIGIARDPARRGRMRASEAGDPARTDYRVLGPVEGWPGCTELALRLHTGRTHQLRVHLAWLGVPVVGDRWYGGPRRLEDPQGASVAVERLYLHAERLLVRQQSPGRSPLELEAPVPW